MGGWGRRDRIASVMAANLAGLESTRRFAARGQPCTEQDFRLFLLLSGSRPDALKRAQLDHLCTHTLKGP
jgi:hypothetical protein